MCTRYYMELSPELRPIIEEARHSALANRMIHHLGRPLKTEGEIRPTDIAPVIASNPRGSLSYYPMIWGFTLPENPNTKRTRPLVNSRVETASTKPLWKKSWSHCRCIVPASYYFEWEHLVRLDGSKKTGDKYMIQPEGATCIWMAGLYRIEEGYPHFTILTRDAAEEIRFIHDRMPLILPGNAVLDWINPVTSQEAVHEIVAKALTEMVYEKAAAR